jgi:replication factor A1
MPLSVFCFSDRLSYLLQDFAIDVVAVVKDASEPQEIQTKFNRPVRISVLYSRLILICVQTFKRDLTLLDKSGFSVRLTLWGKLAETWNVEDLSVVAFKGVKVGDFQGRTLSTMTSSQVSVNPDIPPAYDLRGWYDAMGNQTSFQSHTSSGGGMSGGGISFNRTEIQSLVSVKQSQLGMSEKGDIFSTRATIMYIKEDNLSYPSCPKCHKKAFDQGDSWRCEKCDASYPRPEHRYVILPMVSFDNADIPIKVISCQWPWRTGRDRLGCKASTKLVAQSLE